jgi:Carboxypeptidase regulatory-like domain/TonB-dependent Receptor Plug Domain
MNRYRNLPDRRVLAAAAAMLLLIPALATAQVDTGTILGSVKDASGAAVPGAQVTARNVDTNVARSAKTDATGQYELRFMPIGRYRIEVNAEGFRKFVRTGIALEVNGNTRVDAALETGQIEEVVEVTAEAPLVVTNTAALGKTVGREEIENLPLIDRDVYALLDLTPGVEQNDQTNVFGSPGQEVLINGSSNAGAGSVNYYLDGGNNTGGLRQTGNLVPNPDAVEEFRVVTNNYSAEYGRFAGGIVDVVTKSGTNTFKGSAFEFFRDEHLNARPWTTGPTRDRDPYGRHQFGATLGGPIRRDKTFFFLSYAGQRRRETEYKNDARVPTPLERAGDFSQSGVTIYDPLTGQPFPGNRIPASRLDPVALRILQDYVPLANRTDDASRRFSGYDDKALHPQDRHELQLKLSHTAGGDHQLTGSYFFNKGRDVDVFAGNTDLRWVDRHFKWTQHNINIGDTWTLGGSTVNQARVTYVRSFGGRVNMPQTSLADLGSKFVMQGTPTLPEITISSYFDLLVDLAGPVAGSNLYQFRDLLGFVKGRHSIRVGGEASLEKIVHDADLDNFGDWEFSGTRTRAPGSSSGGNAMADFLLGLPSAYKQDAPIVKIDNGWYFGLFVQDDFKVHPKLTLNVGLRYDLQLPFVDPRDRKLTFIEGRQSTVVPTAPRGLLFPGDEGIGRGIMKTDYNNIAPRLGINWDPKGDGKTAVRAALGIFYGTIGGNMSNTTADRQPFSIRQSIPQVYTLSDPYRNLPIVPFPYEYDPAAPRFLLPADVTGLSPDYVMPYTYQTNVSVQRQIGSSASVTVSYVGARGRKLPIDLNHNYPEPSPTATAQNIQARRPYRPLNTLGAITLIHSQLTTAYDGLQITGEKRMGRAWMLKAYYVLGKGVEDASLQDDQRGSVQDQLDIAADRGRTNNDRRHAAVLSSIWKTRYFDRDTHRVLHALLDGWTLSTVATYRSGKPVNIRTDRDTNFDGTSSTDRPNLTGVDPSFGGDRPRSEQIQQWFNPAAFALPPNGTTGNTPRNYVTGPGLRNMNIGLFRNFGLTDRVTLQLRLESTNAFNFVNLKPPEGRINRANTGAITTAEAMRQTQVGVRLIF